MHTKHNKSFRNIVLNEEYNNKQQSLMINVFNRIKYNKNYETPKNFVRVMKMDCGKHERENFFDNSKR